ncbi:hypothetical protein BHM03_00042529, partial [Ensete ventricosum]
MRWDLARSSLGDSPKELGSSLGTQREIAEKKTRGLATRLPEYMGVDCLVNIFRRLGLDDLTVSVPFVCTCWWRASLDPACWEALNLRSLDFTPWSQFSRSFASRYYLKTLS